MALRDPDAVPVADDRLGVQCVIDLRERDLGPDEVAAVDQAPVLDPHEVALPDVEYHAERAVDDDRHRPAEDDDEGAGRRIARDVALHHVGRGYGADEHRDYEDPHDGPDELQAVCRVAELAVLQEIEGPGAAPLPGREGAGLCFPAGIMPHCGRGIAFLG